MSRTLILSLAAAATITVASFHLANLMPVVPAAAVMPVAAAASTTVSRGQDRQRYAPSAPAQFPVQYSTVSANNFGNSSAPAAVSAPPATMVARSVLVPVTVAASALAQAATTVAAVARLAFRSSIRAVQAIPAVQVSRVNPAGHSMVTGTGFSVMVAVSIDTVAGELADAAPVSVASPGPCTCLTKAYTQDGLVVFAESSPKKRPARRSVGPVRHDPGVAGRQQIHRRSACGAGCRRNASADHAELRGPHLSGLSEGQRAGEELKTPTCRLRRMTMKVACEKYRRRPLLFGQVFLDVFLGRSL